MSLDPINGCIYNDRMKVAELVCACANLRRATRVLTQLYDEELRPAGLRVTQLSILKALGTVADVGQTRLAEAMGFDLTTLTRTLALLRKKGYVDVRPGSDRRERRWMLAARGRSKVGQAMPLWDKAQRRVQRALGKDYTPLQELLHRVAQIPRLD